MTNSRKSSEEILEKTWKQHKIKDNTG